MKASKKDVQPLEVINSLQEYIFKHGEQNTACLLMYEAMECMKVMVAAGEQAEPVKVPSENDLWPKGETRYFCDRCSMTLGAEVVLEIAKDFNPAQAIDHARRIEGEGK